MAKSIKLYTWGYCPFCIRAKNLLDEKGLAYEEVNLDGKDDELKALREKTGQRTVPQIFIDDEFIGGFTELSALNNSGGL